MLFDRPQKSAPKKADGVWGNEQNDLRLIVKFKDFLGQIGFNSGARL